MWWKLSSEECLLHKLSYCDASIAKRLSSMFALFVQNHVMCVLVAY